VAYFYGARTREHLYGVDQVERLAAVWPASFRFVPVLSEEPTTSGWTGLRGLVTEALAADPIDARACDAYLCGPPAMIDAAVARLAELGTPAESIHADRFLDARHLAPPGADGKTGGRHS
jgi:NAD(P)H-flavin reductase